MGLVGAALMVAGGLAYLLNAESGSIGLFNLALGALMVAAAGLLNPTLFRQYGRWLNAFWGGIMVFGIVAMVNFLGNRYPERFDLTEGRLHSLADLTVETLKALDRMFTPSPLWRGAKTPSSNCCWPSWRRTTLASATNSIDPDRDPSRTEDYGIRRYDTLVLEKRRQNNSKSPSSKSARSSIRCSS